MSAPASVVKENSKSDLARDLQSMLTKEQSLLSDLKEYAKLLQKYNTLKSLWKQFIYSEFSVALIEDFNDIVEYDPSYAFVGRVPIEKFVSNTLKAMSQPEFMDIFIESMSGIFDQEHATFVKKEIEMLSRLLRKQHLIYSENPEIFGFLGTVVDIAESLVLEEATGKRNSKARSIFFFALKYSLRSKDVHFGEKLLELYSLETELASAIKESNKNADARIASTSRISNLLLDEEAVNDYTDNGINSWSDVLRGI
ncbi:MAG: hypothetical protein ACP5MC_03290, partial [Candidatus Micrarchaeia archaeon]